MRIESVHQFSPSCSVGDGVTNGLFYTRRLLRSLGYRSEIYCEDIAPALRGEVRPLSQLAPDQRTLLIWQFCLGYEAADAIHALACPKILSYHNITPEALLPVDGPLRRLSRLGRLQLAQWAGRFDAVVAMSEYSCEELRGAGHRDAEPLPLLVDLAQVASLPADEALAARMRDTLNVVFVGRVVENKRHDQLVRTLHELLHLADQPVRLWLAGGLSSQACFQRARALVDELGVGAHVEWLGKVSDAQLGALYRGAHAYLSMSEHEGFGMPLLEAMAFGVPIVAAAHTAVPEIVGPGGIVLSEGTPAEAAAAIQLLATEPGLRRRIREAQREQLAKFDPRRLRERLAATIDRVASRRAGGAAGRGGACAEAPPPAAAPGLPAEAPAPVAALVPVAAPASVAVPTSVAAPMSLAAPASSMAGREILRVEGPVDTAYSLAIVNRGLAAGLARAGAAVQLQATEGRGDLPMPPDLAQRYPELAGVELDPGDWPLPDASLRFCYPPRTDGMRGALRAVHGYGWEESEFPQRYVEWFNRDLDLVTVLSHDVERVLRDNGVAVPIAVVGAGLDQSVHAEPAASTDPLPAGFRFLHVSSCFPRKGPDVLLEAWGRAFRADDDVALVIKTFPNRHNDVARRLEAHRAADPGYPTVRLIERELPAGELAGLYRACDAFVLPSRGEGLGLPAAEAMAHGLPVVATGWGGQTDFCRPDTAWLVDFRFAPAHTHLGLSHSCWADPDPDDLARQLRAVRDATPAERAARTRAAGARIAGYTWDEVARRTRQAIARVRALPAWRPQPSIAWVSTWNTRCGIATASQQQLAHWPADRVVVMAPLDAEGEAADRAAASRAAAAGRAIPAVERNWRMGRDPQAIASIDAMVDACLARGVGAVVLQYNFGFFPVAALGRAVERLAAAGVQVHVCLHSTADVDRPGFKASLAEARGPLALATRLLVHGIDDLNRLARLGLAARAVLWPLGVEAPPRALPALPAGLEQRLAGRTVIASYGFLLPHKGLQCLVRAFAALRERRERLHLLMCNAIYPNGESAQEAEAVRALVARLGLADDVTLVDAFMPDAHSFAHLARADLVVFPYQHTQESASGAVRMALASGAAVAVTPLAIFDDLGDACARLPGVCAPDVERGLDALLDTPAEREALRERAARWLAPRRWPVVARRMLGMIDGLAQPRIDIDAPPVGSPDASPGRVCEKAPSETQSL